MKSYLLLMSVVSVLSSVSVAASGDLELPGEKWLARFDKYVCQAFQATSTPRPAAFERMNLRFEGLSSDASLDNIRLLAVFEENGALCRYSALLLADNGQDSVKLVQSRAFAPETGSACVAGQAVLDQAFQSVSYQYYGHPHRIALLLPFEDAALLCGPGSTFVAPEFVVSGRR